MSGPHFGNFISNISDLVKLFMKNGTISDADMERCEFVKTLKDLGKDKNDCALSRRRCVLMNHQTTLDRYFEELEKKERDTRLRNERRDERNKRKADQLTNLTNNNNKKHRVNTNEDYETIEL